MATLSLRKAQPGPTGPNIVVTRLEADSQSFKQGEFVYLVNGLVTACASNGTTIFGMALHDATGTANSECVVLVATPSQTFRATCSEATAAAVEATDIGVKYAIRVADNRMYLDPSDTDNDAVVILDVINEGIKAGDLNPEAIFQVLPEAIQSGAAAT